MAPAPFPPPLSPPPKKDFVFRNFWERDECHSLLDKLRVDVHKAEEMLNAAAASAAAALALAGDSQEEGDASPTSSSHGNVSIPARFLSLQLQHIRSWLSVLRSVYSVVYL